MRNPGWRSAVCLIALLACVAKARAQDKDQDLPRTPGWSVEVPVELQEDWTAHQRPGSSGYGNLKFKAEPDITAQVTDRFSIEGGLTLEQVRLPPAGRNEALEGEGVYLRQLTANWRDDNWNVYAGKFTPDFGVAWDKAPGIYGQEFANDYKFTDQLGFGGGTGLDAGLLGRMDFTASSFIRDRTEASNSWITSRGRTTEAMGGPSNSDRFGSFTTAIDGHDIPGLGKLAYQLAYTYQGRGEGDTADMSGIVGSLRTTVPMGDDITVTPLVEWAKFNNWNAVAHSDRDFATIAARFDRGPWNLSLADTSRELEVAAGRSSDNSAQVSLGYTFDSGVLAEVGLWNLDDAGVRSTIVGVKLSYTFGER